MKSAIFIFGALFSVFFLSGKSRIGDYYVGFGYGLVDESDNVFEGDSLNLFVNSLASDVVDLDLQYRHSGLDMNISRETVWKLDLGLRYHFDKFHDAEGMFRPFLGVGAQYLRDSASLILEEDGFGWTVEAGTEISFTQSVSFLAYAELYGLWENFQYNDFEINSELTWWIDEEHGLSIAYLHAVDAKTDHVFFKYLYSWR